MQKIIFTLLFFVIFSFKAYAANYDAFILNFLRVTPFVDAVQVEMVLDIPTPNNVKNDLKEGKVLTFLIRANILQERSILPAKEIHSYITQYHLHYDPLTRQFMVINDTKVSIKNTDADYLLKTFIHNLKFKIPAVLEKNEHYHLNIDVSLTQSASQPWNQKNMFFLSGDIIQPATFKYEFDY